MNVTTHVDSIGLKVEFNNSISQSDVLRRLKQYVESISTRLRVISKERFNQGSRLSIDYLVMLDGKITIAKIVTGAYSNYNEIVYYLNVVMAGLQSYDEYVDDIKYNFLLTLTSWFNDKKFNFYIRELDCNIDAECPYENFHVIQVKRAPKNKYNVLEEQMFSDSKYLQKKRKYKTNTQALYYDKQNKENLDIPISRFELKLVFKKNDYLDLDRLYNKIIEGFSRYAVYYFQNINIKEQVINHQHHIENIKAPRTRIYNRLMKDLYSFQLHPDINYIIKYIQTLYTIKGYKMVLEKLSNDTTIFQSNVDKFDIDFFDFL